MTLGEKIRLARLEAGLSQRQLCGDVITRNMLSQIENGAARPSMDTLGYLAHRLGKSISSFLEEQPLESPNREVMAQARTAFDAGNWGVTAEILKQFREPDDVFGREKVMMEYLACLRLARQALAQKRTVYALELLEKAETAERACGYAAGMKQERLLLLARAGGAEPEQISDQLPSLDETLLLRAQAAMARGSFARAAALLEAAEDSDSPEWNLLWGQVFLAQGAYAPAAEHLVRAEASLPEALPLLEQCCREMGDYRRAYEYACKQR